MTVRYIPATPWQGRTDREDGPSARRIHELISAQAHRAVIGFACEEGVRRNKGRLGAALGPDAIRRALAGLPVPARAAGLADLGTIAVSDDHLEDGQAALGRRLVSSLEDHERILVMGGGHETAFGSYLGLAEAFPDQRIGIINLDAHLDLRKPGPDGVSSGTPFFQIREQNEAAFDYLCIGVAEEANTQALFQRAADWGVGMVFDTDLLADPYAAHAAIDALAERSDILYLTIDLDLLPHYQAPGVSAPAVRGVPFSIVEGVVDAVLDATATHSARLAVCDIVELNPKYDVDGITARSAAYLARRLLFGKSVSPSSTSV